MICGWYSVAVSDSPSAVPCENTRRHRDPVSAALIHSQTPTPLNSINPQRSLAIFAPMLAPSPRLVLQRNDCVMVAYEGGGAWTGGRWVRGGVILTVEAPRAQWGQRARAGDVNREVGPSDKSCLQPLQTVGSTRRAAWLLNSERLSTLDTPSFPSPPLPQR